jgi:3-hexulose-6-phosphate synthase
MKNGRKLSPESLLELFSPKFSDSKLARLNLTTSQVSDALNKITGNPGVISRIRPLFDKTVIGRAVTVNTMADDWGTSVKAIDIAKKGEILVIHVEGDDQAVWGELTSKTAQEKGIISTIIDGAVRDVGPIKELRYPVFSKSIVPNAGSPKAEGEINIPITCGNITVNPQDLIIGDECGVVVIPDEHLSKVVDETLNIKKKEAQIISKIEKGYSLSDILELK